MARLDDNALDLMFRHARTHRYWSDGPVTETILREAWELAKMGPTSANCSPMRVIFVVSGDAKQRLKPHLFDGNVRQTMAAPATAIVAYDMEFYEHMTRLWPREDARAWFAGKETLIKTTALRNGSLQGAYLIMALRALGLDCGPMSGFSAKGVDEEFFAGTTWRSNFLCNIGHGDPSHLHPRNDRFQFDEACRIL
jgi:3-hydroxypropanoate dehydrogenase